MQTEQYQFHAVFIHSLIMQGKDDNNNNIISLDVPP